MTEAAEIVGIAKSIAQEAHTLATWALGALGGSMALIIGTSHNAPKSRRGRLIYLMFVPAWVCLALSVYCSSLIKRNYLSSMYAKDNLETMKIISARMNDSFGIQIHAMNAGILFLSLWLGCYLVWWYYNSKDL